MQRLWCYWGREALLYSVMCCEDFHYWVSAGLGLSRKMKWVKSIFFFFFLPPANAGQLLPLVQTDTVGSLSRGYFVVGEGRISLWAPTVCLPLGEMLYIHSVSSICARGGEQFSLHCSSLGLCLPMFCLPWYHTISPLSYYIPHMAICTTQVPATFPQIKVLRTWGKLSQYISVW